MHHYVSLYLSIGMIWVLFQWRYNSRIQEMRRMIGDARMLPVGVLVAVLWPIEVAGLFVYFALVLFNYFVYLWKRIWLGILGLDTDECTVAIQCPVCKAHQAWPGSPEQMQALGWELRVVNGQMVVWHCPMCKGNGEPWPPKR